MNAYIDCDKDTFSIFFSNEPIEVDTACIDKRHEALCAFTRGRRTNRNGKGCKKRNGKLGRIRKSETELAT